MRSVSVFLDIAKVSEFPSKNDDVSRTQWGVSHDVYIFLDFL